MVVEIDFCGDLFALKNVVSHARCQLLGVISAKDDFTFVLEIIG